MTTFAPPRGLSLDLVAGTLVVAAGSFAPSSCGEGRPPSSRPAPTAVEWDRSRERMVTEQIAARGISDSRLLAALRDEPRHEYVPSDVRPLSYGDHPIPIGHDQTISQPYVVARMTELLRVEVGSRVLEIGTGSGYQAAILDRLGARVFSIELVTALCERARRDLARLGHGSVQVRCGDGYAGWPAQAPFDRILLTAAPVEVPEALVAQLAPEGRLVAPVGSGVQQLIVVSRAADGTLSTGGFDTVRFVPMVHGPGAP